MWGTQTRKRFYGPNRTEWRTADMQSTRFEEVLRGLLQGLGCLDHLALGLVVYAAKG